ncbi:MAG: nuclear transport factor 2 family protein [Candidatus Eisenbacteria bacterium]
MRFVLPLFVGVLALASPAVSAAKPAPGANADSVAIRATLDTLNAVCARRDSVAFDALFDSREPLLFVGSSEGEEFHGRPGVRRFRRFLFSMPFVFSFDLAHVTIRSDGDHGWAYFDGRMLRRSPSGKEGGNRYRFLIAMEKRGGAWKWTAFHGAVPGGE